MAHTNHVSEGAIREQAYYLWEQDGRPPGREMEYWQRATVLAAEKAQVDTLTQAPPKRPGKAKAAAAEVKTAASKAKPTPVKAPKLDSKGKPKKK